MFQITRIKDIQQKLNEYERIIKLKLDYDLDILLQLAKLDDKMTKDSNVVSESMTDDDLSDEPELLVPINELDEDDELLEPALPPPPTTPRAKRGRPKKGKKN